MKVLYAVSEAKPFIASGGLGDVAGSLPIALRKRLIGCRVVMPLYDGIPEKFKAEMKFITQSLHGQHISYLFGLLEEPSQNQKFALDQIEPKQNEFNAKFFNPV